MLPFTGEYGLFPPGGFIVILPQGTYSQMEVFLHVLGDSGVTSIRDLEGFLGIKEVVFFFPRGSR